MPTARALRESGAYPAMGERGYGWEKLFFEMVCQEYSSGRGLKTAIARFHNVYGPWGTWDAREPPPPSVERSSKQMTPASMRSPYGARRLG